MNIYIYIYIYIDHYIYDYTHKLDNNISPGIMHISSNLENVKAANTDPTRKLVDDKENL